MVQLPRVAVLFSAFFAFSAAPAFAETYREGIAAYDNGEYEKAAEIWKPLAEKGQPEALRSLAQLFRLGVGVSKDSQMSFELFREAAENGLSDAQVHTAFLYLTGEGTKRDEGAAALWFARAADQGDKLAQFNLGLMYEKGVGVERDVELARELYSLAADQGQARAIERLAAIDGKPVANQASKAANTAKAQSPTPVAKTEQSAASAAQERGDGAEKGLIVRRSESESRSTGQEAAANAGNVNASQDPMLIIRRSESSGMAASNKPEDQQAWRSTVVVPRQKMGVRNSPVPLIREIPVERLNAFMSNTAKPVMIKEIPVSSIAPASKANSVRNIAPARATTTQIRTVRSQSLNAAPLNQAQSSIRNALIAGDRAYRAGNFDEASRIFAGLSNQGIPIAQFVLGRMFDRGEGVPRDPLMAYNLWRTATERGSSRAATALTQLSARLSPQELRAANERFVSFRRGLR